MCELNKILNLFLIFRNNVEISSNKFISTRHYIYNIGNNKDCAEDLENGFIYSLNILHYIKITITKN